jgi:hypothetical protein
MKHDKPDLGSNFWSPKLSVCALTALLGLTPEVSRADESGDPADAGLVYGRGLLSHHHIGVGRRSRGERPFLMSFCLIQSAVTFRHGRRAHRRVTVPD